MTEKNYFVTANSSEGFCNYILSNLSGLNHIYVLTGKSNYCKRLILSSLELMLPDNISEIELIHSSFEPDYLDGIILRGLKTGIISDVILSDDLQAKLSLSQDIISTDDVLSSNIEYLLPILSDNEMYCDNLYKMAYAKFQNGIRIHDEWEKIYIENMDFFKADLMADDIIDMLFTSAKPSLYSGITYHRFFGGATWKGSIDYVIPLTENISHRYFIKGRPGSGKSTLLKRIQKYAEKLQYTIEVYHCGFDPDSLDMLIIPELDCCLFDSTAPHEYYPSKPTDQIIDMYSELIKKGTDEYYKEELLDIILRYKSTIGNGVQYMKQAHKADAEINSILRNYIYGDEVNSIARNIISNI